MNRSLEAPITPRPSPLDEEQRGLGLRQSVIEFAPGELNAALDATRPRRTFDRDIWGK